MEWQSRRRLCAHARVRFLRRISEGSRDEGSTRNEHRGQDRAQRRCRDPFPGSVADMGWRSVTAKDGHPIAATMDDTLARVARTLADVEEPAQRVGAVRAFPVGAAQARSRRAGSCRTPACSRTSRRPPRSIAPCRGRIDLDSMDDILNKGRTRRAHAEGGWDRLRVLDAAPARRLRRRRGCAHFRSDVVHGYLRQDVFHRLVGRRPAWRADGHVRCRPPGRDGLHPPQARERAPAAVATCRCW